MLLTAVNVKHHQNMTDSFFVKQQSDSFDHAVYLQKCSSSSYAHIPTKHL